MPCIGQLRLVLATRYLVILARGYEDRITTSPRITRHPVALEADWYNKIADGLLKIYQHAPHLRLRFTLRRL